MQTTNSQRLTIAAFLVSTLLGANNSIAVRFSNAELPPFFGAAMRFAAASLILFLVVLALRLPMPTGRSFAGTMLFGLLQFGLSYAFLYWSLLRVTAGMTQVILALVPLLTFIFAILHRQEVFQWRILVGGLLAMAGIAVIFRNQISADVPLAALLTIVLAAACFAEAAVLFKTFPKSHPITTNALAMGVGALVLFLISQVAHEVPAVPSLPATWAAVIYLVVCGSITTFVLVLYVLKRWKASATAYQLVLMPVLTILFASWLAGESVTPVFLIGGSFVLAGVYVGAIASPRLLEKFSLKKSTG